MMGWMVLFWILVILLALAVVSRLFPKAQDHTARRTLRERLVRGEITESEYREAMRALNASEKRSTGFAPVVVLLLLALVILLLVAGFGGMGMPGWMPGMPGMSGMPHMRGWTPPTSAPSVRPGARLVPVTLADFAFRPASIRVRAGEPVNLRLVNAGRVTHDLYVPALGFRVTVEPGEEVVAGLPALQPGTYEFYCSLPGHREAGMRGTLVVEP
ncbi:MAG: cupredoxin domain-containing protein [Armatimonadota bacterium]|nr:cupredoxin domain-containing protein [Armatimonadota bacterium]MDR7443955.1 cupredoxin domain-containing protein [Armatimonadota bacterium]MDR7570053.1 cupredoxin domain-containing protein [Armatimonadota bacterium]MDR7615442.1 cupredoxin domain-containing protein [Armatimonadota bacterium]